jgi:hypothetical protein
MKKHFPMVLAAVGGITLLSGIGSGVLAIIYGSEMSAVLADYQRSLNFLFVVGSGAIFALLAVRSSE